MNAANGPRLAAINATPDATAAGDGHRKVEKTLGSAEHNPAPTGGRARARAPPLQGTVAGHYSRIPPRIGVARSLRGWRREAVLLNERRDPCRDILDRLIATSDQVEQHKEQENRDHLANRHQVVLLAGTGPLGAGEGLGAPDGASTIASDERAGEG